MAVENRIDATFRRLAEKGEKALVAYVTAGYPRVEMSGAVLRAAAEAGADIIELGIPFSDPVADGPTIQAASQRALEGGFQVRHVFDLTAEFRANRDEPVVIFSYYNPIFALGVRDFVRQARDAGADGLLIVDLPLEEEEEVVSSVEEAGLRLIRLVAPTTECERLSAIARRAEGFLYCVSVTGVTGAREQLDAGVFSMLKRVKEASPVPVCLGFGISRPEHVRTACRHADGVVVGSALIRKIEEGLASGGDLGAARAFISRLKEATRGS